MSSIFSKFHSLVRFHCDDALAVGLLRCLPEYKTAVVVRTRDQKLIDQGSVVVDVGGVYGELIGGAMTVVLQILRNCGVFTLVEA